MMTSVLHRVFYVIAIMIMKRASASGFKYAFSGDDDFVIGGSCDSAACLGKQSAMMNGGTNIGKRRQVVAEYDCEWSGTDKSGSESRQKGSMSLVSLLGLCQYNGVLLCCCAWSRTGAARRLGASAMIQFLQQVMTR